MSELEATGTPAIEVASPPPGAGTIPETPPAASNWLLEMPEEMQNDPSLNNFKDIESLARSYVETKRMVGDRVKVPDENSPPEEVAKFYAKLGVPEKPEEYKFTSVENIPPGMDIAQLDAFTPIFHKLRLTKAQADGIRQEYVKSIQEQHTKMVTDYKAEMAQKTEVLKGRWGDQFDTKLEVAKRFFSTAPEPVKLYVERNGLGDDADFIEWIYQMGVATSEDTMRQGSPTQQKTLDQQITAVEMELYALGYNDPKRKELIAKRDELYQQRFPQLE